MESRKRNGGRPVDYISDLLRGSTDSLLLALVGESPKYGYSIIKEIEKRHWRGEIRFKEGTLYPALHRLEKDGLIKGEWVSVKGMERRYYSLNGTRRRGAAKPSPAMAAVFQRRRPHNKSQDPRRHCPIVRHLCNRLPSLNYIWRRSGAA